MIEGVARYQRMAIPLDLGALTLEAPALAHGAALRAETGAAIRLVTVVGPGPHSSGLNGVEQKAALQALADQARARFGVPFTSDILREADPAATCNEALERYFAAHDIELVIMSSHPPRVSDHWLPVHGQWLAAHSARSLLLLR
jgi:nucleotide-binding universal stress UspA family protein